MARAEDLHQIVYRWHDRLDLSPVASTMSPDSLRSWDSWIRSWVRHPHVDGLGESLCYQVQPNGRAALAWRYEDWYAAGRADGARGRPLVSRVLTGQASQLTPEVAIALGHAGPPASAGPAPGQVTRSADLGRVATGDLTRLVGERAAKLDQAAARQHGYLLRIIAPALADPRTPIAVHLADADLLKPPDQGLACLLLWGLWRIAGPVLGAGGRGWSFSTFELPLGDVDPATMPDILFRQVHYPSRAVARPRKELKLRPSEAEPLDEAHEFVELATWLLGEYQEKGGDGVRRLVESCQGADRSVQPRLSRIYDELRATRPPVTLPPTTLPPVTESTSEPVRVQPGIVKPAIAEPIPVEPVRVEPVPVEPVLAEPVPVESVSPAEPVPVDQFESDRPIRSPWQHYREAQHSRQAPTSRPAPRPAVSVLLKKLSEAENDRQFVNLARDMLNQRAAPEFDDRHLSRREISKPEWYAQVKVKCRPDSLVYLLTGIFAVIVIPDLDLPEVIDKVAEWTEEAEPAFVGGLLAAARRSGEDTSRTMMELVQHRLAYRWMLENNVGDCWYTVSAPRASGFDRGGLFGLRRKN